MPSARSSRKTRSSSFPSRRRRQRRWPTRRRRWSAQLIGSDHGLARAVALPPRRRPRRRRLLAQTGALCRHRRRPAARARVRPRDRPLRGGTLRVRSARPRRTFARRRGGNDRHVPDRRRRPHLVGCSGWNYDSWRHGVFYPERCPSSRWLEHYARHFDTVELNATFYRLPTVKAVQRWVEQTPDDFVFAVKMSRYVTHVKRLRDLAPSLELFYSRIAPLVGTPKLGPVLWQLPPTFRRDDARLAQALE